jgi:hypothetical protein
LSGLVTARAVFLLAVGISTSGCDGSRSQVQPAAFPAPAISFDGRYEGTMRMTGSSLGMSRSNCATSPRISVEVKNNQFSLATPHPEAVASTPSLTDRATPVYNATIRPDGSIVGISNQTNATMQGRIFGSRMSGQIFGLLCYYEFTADRV